ncbi:hypothetical protein GGTG_01171 [Gaeumannomyces tritici R3-111a-1]|uniref:Uncharacterized protein n=1 Tax=Gaeumannomyces tritici (strain R3-111a-1) TaxID=644352 RepID=J3NIT7_GAET3|nr:hypothetical protein GGTG_01171 [Gaeumannomyces tritici R3-111a-1]EJT81187.1 hypothetical protein GGTG_01171 [Gaeumannomyces tritici R3-111a-1]
MLLSPSTGCWWACACAFIFWQVYVMSTLASILEWLFRSGPSRPKRQRPGRVINSAATNLQYVAVSGMLYLQGSLIVKRESESEELLAFDKLSWNYVRLMIRLQFRVLDGTNSECSELTRKEIKLRGGLRLSSWLVACPSTTSLDLQGVV